MGIVAVPSSASRSTFGSGGGFTVRRSPPLRRPFIVLSFKGEPVPKCSEAVVSPPVKEAKKSPGKRSKRGKGAVVSAAAVAPSADACARDPGYDEVAAALENIYKLSPADALDWEANGVGNVVRNRKKRAKRLGLEERVRLRQGKEEEESVEAKKRGRRRDLEGDAETLVREYSISTDLYSLDWKRVKIPPVLSSAEHKWLFELMQPMKAIMQVKEDMSKDLNKEPTDGELADAVNMSILQLRRHLEVGQAARNKLIKHNLRLVLFVINKYYPEIATGHKFQEFCQAGVTGLITAIDRFEPKRGFRLSTYGLFWIRHSIIRSMTLASFTKVPFGIESVRQEIQKAKLELSFELGRQPTEKEIAERAGISLNAWLVQHNI